MLSQRHRRTPLHLTSSRLQIISRSTRLAAAVASVLLLTPTLHAQSTSWLTAASDNWNVSSRWSAGVPNSSTADATFAATGSSYTVTLSDNRTARSLYLASASATLSHTGGVLTVSTLSASSTPGTLLLSGGTIAWTGATNGFASTIPLRIGPNHAIFDTSAASLTLDNPLLSNSSSGGLTKLGSGTLTLRGVNTYTGPTTIASGTLQLGNGGATGSIDASAITVAASGTLALNRSDNITFASPLFTGAGTLWKRGSGTVTFTAAQTYAGPTAVSGGTLQIGNGGNTGSIASNTVHLSLGTSLTFDLSKDFTYPGLIDSNGGLTQMGQGTLTLTASQLYSGPTTVTAGTLSFTGGIVYSTSFSVGSGACLNFNATGAVLQVGSSYSTSTNVSGSGVVSKSGAGILGWALNAEPVFSLGSGSMIDVQSGTFFGDSRRTNAWSNNLSALNIASSAVFTGGTADVRIDALTGAGTLTFDATGSLLLGVNNTAATAYNPAGTATFSGVIADGNITRLVKLGTGTQILTGNNTYTGPTTVYGSTLQLGNGGTTGSLASNAITVAASGALAFSRSDNLTFSGIISGPGTVIQSGTGTLTFTGDQTYTGPTTITSGTLQLGNGGTTGSLTNTSALSVAANAALTFNRSDNLTYSSPVFSGAGGFTQMGPNTITFTGTQNYTGPTCVNGGLLQLLDGGALSPQSPVTVNSGGILRIGNDLPTGPVTVAAGGTLLLGNGGTSGSASGHISLSNGANIAFNRSDHLTYSDPIITGTGRLTQFGPGTLTFTGIQTYTGPTTVSNGLLEIINAGALSTSSSITVQFGATLRVGNDNSTGNVTVRPGGTLLIGNGGTTGSLTSILNLNDGASLAFNRSDNLTFSAFPFNGASSLPFNSGLTQMGPGTLTLTANQLYYGPTTVSGGTLSFAGDYVYSSSFSVSSLAMLNFNVTGAILHLGTGNASTTIFSGSGVVSKTGPGMLRWNGSTAAVFALVSGSVIDVQAGNFVGGSSRLDAWSANLSALNIASSAVFTGGTADVRIDALTGAGTLTFDTAGSLFLGVNNTAATEYNPAGTATFSGSIADGNITRLAKLGTGTQILTGPSTYTGPTTISGGTLQLASGTTYRSQSFVIASGARLDLNVAAGTNIDPAADVTFSGSGTLAKTGPGLIYWNSSAATFALGSGAVIDVQGGTFIGGFANNENWFANLSALNLAAGTVFYGVEADLRFDALTGAGALFSGYGSTRGSITIGVNNTAATAYNLAGTATFSGTIADDGASICRLTKVGTGTQIFTGNNTYTGPTTISAGTLISPHFGPGPLSISSSAVASISYSPSIPSLSILSSLSLTGTARLDLSNNVLIVRSTPSDTLRQLVANWYANGARNGPGLGMSLTSNPYTTLAVFPNSTPTGDPYFPSLAGVSLLPSDTIIRYTYLGDTNLDGVLDGTDYKHILEGLIYAQSGWINGDADNSGGPITTTDLQLFLQAYSAYRANPLPIAWPTDTTPTPTSPIPEPTTSLLILTPIATLSRRRRS